MQKNDKKLRYIIITSFFLYTLSNNKGINISLINKNLNQTQNISNIYANIKLDKMTSVEYNKKKYLIPDEYLFTVKDNVLTINKENDWSCNIEIMNEKFTNLLLEKYEVKNKLENKNIKVESIDNVYYGNNNYLKYTLSGGLYNHLILYKEYSKLQSYKIELISFKGNMEEQFSKEIKPIIESVVSI